MSKVDVKWRCWSSWDHPDTAGPVRESTARIVLPTGSELAAAVVWQQAANNGQGLSLWTEDSVIVEIVEPAEFAGHYEVHIDYSVETRGCEMGADQVREMYADA